ncbi:XrtB/PEP-CTERM-associated polysaccharide biosynthesis outer membrane protein EpsL [Duganella sp. HH105]|uniref:XrtB/PEP-CTERM-associated polysaccharide biosynthesis outer membrane protein EpsL n=1 Tax=Duganella sp. HH105 TaxID=1781067 RepID=UPI000877BD81|nr:XrtB/PEP-CTERM-associated polysaccharide biosynthesis outer membrane protein EpsL [Duganella sp. HH105]OEZ61632.1 hypothetical protein DUGA6_20810 [Duganella sp. HH105]
MHSPVQTTSRGQKPLLRLLPLAILGLAATLPAHAELSDTIHPFVAATYTHDDNLLRLDDNIPGFLGPRDDNLRQLQVGALFDRPIGRQVLSGHAKMSKVTFDHYDAFNYDGRDYLADLLWRVGSHVDGHVGLNYVQTLTPFTDYHSTERNLRIQRRSYGDINWLFHPSWRVHAGFERSRSEYDLTAQRFNNRTDTTTDAGLDFLASSSSRVGILLRRVRGTYELPRFSGGQLFDNGYEQDEVNANINWVFSGTTQFQLLGGYARRTHAALTSRDSNGPNGRATFIWSPAARLRLTFSGWRVFEAVEGNVVNNSLNKGASAAASWDLSSKIMATARVQRERRDFNAAAGAQLPPGASDSSNSLQAGLTYMPTVHSQISLNANRQRRTGSPLVGTGSFLANSISLNGSIQF